MDPRELAYELEDMLLVSGAHFAGNWNPIPWASLATTPDQNRIDFLFTLPSCDLRNEILKKSVDKGL